MALLLAGCGGGTSSGGTGGTGGGAGGQPSGTLTFSAGTVVYELDLASGVQTSLMDGSSPYRAENGNILFLDYWGDVSLTNASATSKTTLVSGCSLCSDPTLSPNGELFAYQGWEQFAELGFHTVVRMPNGESVAAYPNLERPVWGPDGVLIMSGDDSQGVHGLYRVQPDYTTSPATFGSASRFDPDLANPSQQSISPDGSTLAFRLNDHLWLMGTDGSGLTKITTSDKAEGWPTWSPDGKRIAYQADLSPYNSHGYLAILDLETGIPSYVRDSQGQQVTASGQMTWR